MDLNQDSLLSPKKNKFLYPFTLIVNFLVNK
jgi:hypothetical protein